MRRFAVLLIAAVLALAPAVGDARPGQGLSLGSRGSRTWSAPAPTQSAPGGAFSFQRSLTPNGGSSFYGSRPYAPSPGYGGYGGYGYRNSFTSGLLGGLVGAGLGGLLFGHGFFGFRGGSGFLGLLIQLVLLFFLARWLFRRMGVAVPAMAGGPGLFGRTMPNPMGGAGNRAGQRPLTITSADYQAFTQLLLNVQAAWSNHDTDRLRAMTTPEMTGYFAEQMAEQASRGVRNQVFNVQLQQGDLSEAWSEGNRDYATVSLRYSMIDVTRDQTGRVVDGSPTERVTVTEFWTFLRSSGGHWILSAIQQAR